MAAQSPAGALSQRHALLAFRFRPPVAVACKRVQLVLRTFGVRRLWYFPCACPRRVFFCRVCVPFRPRAFGKAAAQSPAGALSLPHGAFLLPDDVRNLIAVACKRIQLSLRLFGVFRLPPGGLFRFLLLQPVVQLLPDFVFLFLRQPSDRFRARFVLAAQLGLCLALLPWRLSQDSRIRDSLRLALDFCPGLWHTLIRR